MVSNLPNDELLNDEVLKHKAIPNYKVVVIDIPNVTTDYIQLKNPT